MTTVADLVAKLGFQVEESGFKKFQKYISDFNSIVKDGLSNLREYAKQAERISKAFKEAYLPTRQEASSRYRAEIYAIRAKAYAQRVRAKWLPEQLSIRRLNAETRARQTTLKEAGLGVGGSVNALSATQSALSGGFSGIITAIATAIGGPIAGMVTSLVTKMVSGIVSGFMSAVSWLWGRIKDGLKYAMAFRDYRTFTSRNTGGLENILGLAKGTTNLTQQQVLKDATQIGQQFWDMWFGGGNPAAWQLLGITPTGNGAKDLNTILKAIRGSAGENRGLALNLLKQFGLSEDYMVIMYDMWEKFKREGGKKDFIPYLDEELNQYTKLNEAVRNFEFQLQRISGQFALWVDSTFGLNTVLNSITNYLKGIIIALQHGESLMGILTSDPRKYAMYGSYNKKLTAGEVGLFSSKETLAGLFSQALSGKYGAADLLKASMSLDASMGGILRGGNVFHNVFNMQGQPLDESVPAANQILDGEKTYNPQLSSATITAPNLSY